MLHKNFGENRSRREGRKEKEREREMMIPRKNCDKDAIKMILRVYMRHYFSLRKIILCESSECTTLIFRPLRYSYRRESMFDFMMDYFNRVAPNNDKKQIASIWRFDYARYITLYPIRRCSSGAFSLKTGAKARRALRRNRHYWIPPHLLTSCSDLINWRVKRSPYLDTHVRQNCRLKEKERLKLLFFFINLILRARCIIYQFTFSFDTSHTWNRPTLSTRLNAIRPELRSFGAKRTTARNWYRACAMTSFGSSSCIDIYLCIRVLGERAERSIRRWIIVSSDIIDRKSVPLSLGKLQKLIFRH